MSKPVIGITAGRRNEAATRDEIQTATLGCALEYFSAIVKAGGAPVLLPRCDNGAVLQTLIDRLDGVLLSGGGDVVSLHYGEEPHPRTVYQDPLRDRMEFAVIRLALERGLPIFGICRGIQSLNVAMGGSLLQDIPSGVPGACQHYSKSRDTVLAHSVEIAEDSRLARILETTETTVNSYHHQALGKVAAGLRVNCRARDGIIEGLESADDRPILAVQFHPEDCFEDYPLFIRLFEWFVEQCNNSTQPRETVGASSKANTFEAPLQRPGSRLKAKGRSRGRPA